MSTSTPHANASTALILGITGGYGQAMALAMLDAGWSLRALVRDLERARSTLPARLTQAVELVQGDVFDEASLRDAARGVAVIVHGVNLPQHEWATRLMPLIRCVIQAAREAAATIAYPGNVYPFKPSTDIRPDTPMRPPTAKGLLRMRAHGALAEATTQGVRVITLRAGDFFGMAHASSWMTHILQKARAGGPLQVPAHPGIRHAWAHLPDLAHAHVRLLDQRDALPALSVFHFAGHALTEEDLVGGLRDALGDPTRSISRVRWWVLRGVGLFEPSLAEVVKMRYLWEHEVLLNQDALEAQLGDVRHTPLAEALGQELAATPGQRRA